MLYGNAVVSHRFASLLPALSVHYSFDFSLPPVGRSTRPCSGWSGSSVARTFAWTGLSAARPWLGSFSPYPRKILPHWLVGSLVGHHRPVRPPLLAALPTESGCYSTLSLSLLLPSGPVHPVCRALVSCWASSLSIHFSPDPSFPSTICRLSEARRPAPTTVPTNLCSFLLPTFLSFCLSPFPVLAG